MFSTFFFLPFYSIRDPVVHNLLQDGPSALCANVSRIALREVDLLVNSKCSQVDSEVGTQAEVRGYPAGVSSLPPPLGAGDLTLGIRLRSQCLLLLRHLADLARVGRLNGLCRRALDQ